MSTKVITFQVPGKAQGLDRSRQAANGHRFDTEKNKTNKAYICLKAEAAAEEAGVALPIPPYRKGYTLYMVIYSKPPKSYTKKKLAEIQRDEWKPLTKPDVDNVLKLYLDAMNGRIIEDDRFMTEVNVKRAYGSWDGVWAMLAWEDDEPEKEETEGSNG